MIKSFMSDPQARGDYGIAEQKSGQSLNYTYATMGFVNPKPVENDLPTQACQHRHEAQGLLIKVSSPSALGAEVPTPNSQDLHECPGVVEDHDLGPRDVVPLSEREFVDRELRRRHCRVSSLSN